MARIRLEAMAWAAEALEHGTEHLIQEEEIEQSTTVRDLLNRLATRHKGFDLVFDPNTQKLTEAVRVVLNGRLLELVNGLDSVLHDGDVLMLLPAYVGG